MKFFKEEDLLKMIRQAQLPRYQGSGTISQFSLSNGWNINENIAIGVEANYNFGKFN